MHSIAGAYTLQGPQTAYFPVTDLGWIMDVALREAVLRNSEYGKTLL
jgi:hypothetical protein